MPAQRFSRLALLVVKSNNMAKLKLRKGTKYPFKHLDKIGSKFTVQAPKSNVNAAYAMYKAKNNIACEILEYEDGNIVVTRIA